MIVENTEAKLSQQVRPHHFIVTDVDDEYSRTGKSVRALTGHGYNLSNREEKQKANQDLAKIQKQTPEARLLEYADGESVPILNNYVVRHEH